MEGLRVVDASVVPRIPGELLHIGAFELLLPACTCCHASACCGCLGGAPHPWRAAAHRAGCLGGALASLVTRTSTRACAASKPRSSTYTNNVVAALNTACMPLTICFARRRPGGGAGGGDCRACGGNAAGRGLDRGLPCCGHCGCVSWLRKPRISLPSPPRTTPFNTHLLLRADDTLRYVRCGPRNQPVGRAARFSVLMSPWAKVPC